METHPAVRPFRVDVPKEDLDDLRRRIAAPRRAALAQQGARRLTYFNEVDRGGHFAAWEEPELLLGGDSRGVQVTALTGGRGRRARSRTTGGPSPQRSPKGRRSDGTQ
jgi:hypothetical protein